MTKPSTYNRADLEKDTVVDDRDQVKVTFAGGNSWHIQVEGVDEHESVRGGEAAWTRAEALRKELNDDYSGPPSDGDKANGASDDESDEPAKAPKKAKAKTSKSKKAKADKGKDAERDGGKVIHIGHIQGVQKMVPVSVVEELLSDQTARVATLRGSDEARRLSRRVRATDGRCAPIFLTRHDIEDEDEEPKLFDGLFTLAAAMNLELEKVSVVILPSGSVSEVQGMISQMMRSNLSQPELGTDDDLRMRASQDD